jgi:two-component sensor histidine kinase/integral membrane sensor domain MASE1
VAGIAPPMHKWTLPALIGVGVAYFVLAKAGLALASVNPSATPIWPPTGLAIAATLLFGPIVAPFVFVAAWLANQTTTGLLWSSLAIACGNTLEALVAAYLMKRLAGGVDAFQTPSRVLRFAAICFICATPISAIIGVIVLTLSGLADIPDLPEVWLTWWLGDFAGAVTVAPVIVLWTKHSDQPQRWRLLDNAGILYGGAALIGLVAFSPLLKDTLIRGPLAFLAILPLLFSALRCTQRETATVALILAACAVWGTAAGGGPFDRATANESFLLLVMFFISISVPSLVLAAEVGVRRVAEQNQDRILAEKEMLIREVHHRVKNNLQVISSMIHLRSKRAPEEMQPQFDALAQRIHAMGRVYEQIHGVEDMSEIDLSHYLRQIADLVRTEDISVEVDAVPVTVAIDTAIPLGLVAIELITNAVKHAFLDSGGTVRVSLRKLNGHNVQLRVADDGIGLLPDRATPGSIGMQIVQGLVKQIDGTLETSSAPGTIHTIQFPVRSA